MGHVIPSWPAATVLIWLVLAAAPAAVRADAVMVTKAMTASTIAEFFVEDRGVRVEMEVGASDLDAFRNLLPDSLYSELGHEPRPLAERIPHFFQRDWVIRSAGGEPLSGLVLQLDARRRLTRDEITGEPLPVQPEDAERVLFVELMYRWETRPQSLSIQPPLADDGRVSAANVGFVLYHDGVPVNDFRYLGAQSTVDLDWKDPWYSRFRNRNLKRQFDAPLSVFLYVDFFEVRKEIVVRPKDLQQWVDLGLEGAETIPVVDQAALKEQVAQFLSARGLVTVDQRPMTGTLDRIHFIRRSLRTTGVIDPPEPLDVNSATLGVIFVYPIDELPQEVTVAWDLWGAKIQGVPAAATDEAGGLPSLLTPDDPLLVWKNFLINPTIPAMMAVDLPEQPRIFVPLISGVCFAVVLLILFSAFRQARRERSLPKGRTLATGAVLITAVLCLPYARVSLPSPLSNDPVLRSQQANEVLQALLYNVYRAFDHRDESRVYDQLALSIAGDLLSDVYLQVRRSTELANQGGARVKIDSVELFDAERVSPPTGSELAFHCRWNASGSVGHWGHIHRRTNQYDALVAIAAVDGAWKITSIVVRDEQRLNVEFRTKDIQVRRPELAGGAGTALRSLAKSQHALFP